MRIAAAFIPGQKKTWFSVAHFNKVRGAGRASTGLTISLFPLIFRIPTDRINWTTSSFLIGTFFLTLTAVPLYLWYFGFVWFHFVVFSRTRLSVQSCRSVSLR